ncbi:MAG: tripartite tricarboxylate transporter TctB family protein [Lachnospiraceae bacterium]|nr:tripartite tricarboxylate transporter TctB family protein [Lachnospiraceae bacterium]
MPNYIKKIIPSAIVLALDLFILYLIPTQVNVLIEGMVTTRFMPYVVTILIAVCAVVDIVETYVKGRASEEGRAEIRYFDVRGLLRVLASVISLVVWLFILPRLGFVLSTVLLGIVTMWLLGERNWKVILVLSVILSLSVYCIFKLGLDLRLPTGLFLF